MVTLKANTINVEFGFALNYQWAIDVQEAAIRHYDTAKQSIVSVYHKAVTTGTMATSRGVDLVCNTADDINVLYARACLYARALPVRMRDKFTSLLLGIPADKLPALREMIVNPPAVAVVSRAAKKAVSKSSEIAIPDFGALVDVAEFRMAIDRIKRVVSKSALPILNNVLIRTENGYLILTGTDLEVSLETKVSASIKDLKPITVSVKDLSKAIAGTKGTLALYTDEVNNLIICIGSKRMTLSTITADEYPSLPALEEATWQPVQGIFDAISNVLSAASGDESRSVLMGILIKDNKLVATDTHRLHVADLPGTLEDWNDAIVPAKVCSMLSKALGAKSNDSIEITRTNSTVWFRFADNVVCSRIIDGTFPNWERVISINPTIEMNVNPAELIDAVSGLASVAKEHTNRIEITAKDGKLILTAGCGDISAESTINLVSSNAVDGFVFAMDYRYLLDALSPLAKYDAVTLSGTHKVCAFLFTTGSMPEYQAIVMPMGWE